MLPTMLDLASLKAAYASGLTPLDVMEEIISRRKACDDPAFSLRRRRMRIFVLPPKP